MVNEFKFIALKLWKIKLSSTWSDYCNKDKNEKKKYKIIIHDYTNWQTKYKKKPNWRRRFSQNLLFFFLSAFVLVIWMDFIWPYLVKHSSEQSLHIRWRRRNKKKKKTCFVSNAPFLHEKKKKSVHIFQENKSVQALDIPEHLHTN